MEKRFQKQTKFSLKSSLGGPKIWFWSFQNRAWRLQGRCFLKTSILRAPQRSCAKVFGSQSAELGSMLEAQEPPKSRPRREKIEVQKQYIFQEGFLFVRPSFWKGFGRAFEAKTRPKCENAVFAKSLKILLPSRRN